MNLDDFMFYAAVIVLVIARLCGVSLGDFALCAVLAVPVWLGSLWFTRDLHGWFPCER